ncbi:hypothetical protein O9H85_14175 [Paenibacillus filicis]|uniref:RCK N-terminal domain-containing protein n=1 Tax=Paenibacillus gyeongsangnamensis TaxID=3388067 RepID=A0ABT4Q9M1_9BACL|nr:hypothetical protein [Paenibacillus filicis]MCZ8513560.1 hypothetical protein [Paenibacillus filicis]
MEKQQEFILVSAPNKIGEAFIRQLKVHQLPFVAIVNNKGEQNRLEKLGAKNIIMVDTSELNMWIMPNFPIGKVFLFENSLTLCCRYIQICRNWTSEPIYVITHSNNPRLIYKGIGASHVIHTNNDEVSFLIHSLVG